MSPLANVNVRDGEQVVNVSVVLAKAAPNTQLLPVHRKCQQHISRHAAPLSVAGVHQHHSIGNRGASRIHRTAVSSFAVDGRKFVRGIRVP